MNKLRYNVISCLADLFLFVTGGCSDYFDVRPKSQVLADELFSTEEGFSDQFTGVYKILASTSLYGQEMTFGLAEALTQNYDLATGSEYYEAGLYNYENTAVKNKITTVWSQMYSAIANLNIMLEYIDKNPAMFSGDNYRIYKGEALGLRAFLHLDLLRMFAPSYASNAQAPAIPYVMTYSTAVTPQSTVDKVLDYVIADAREALGLLETDPLFLADSLEAYTYRNDRSYRFNYYAVAATLARAYQWKGGADNLAQALVYARKVIEENARKLNIPITIFESDIFESVYHVEKSPCYLCARMRRGYLYSKAQELGCNKIALGHHFDDVIETIVMGMLYGAQIQTMMPKLHSTNFPGMELIRPLYLVREDDIIHWARYNDLHFIQCACRFTENCASCGGTEKGSKRAEIKAMIHELERQNPYVAKNIFRSVENVNLNTVIGYKKDGIRHNFLDTYDNIADER